MKKYKALITDLDGTLIPNSRDGQPSQRVIESIAKARDLIHIGIATVRPYEYTVSILNQLKLSGPVILLGGAQIIDGATHQMLIEYPISKGELAFVEKYLKTENIEFILNGLDTPPKAGSNVYTILALGITEEKADDIQSEIAKNTTLAAHKSLSWRKDKYCLNISHTSATKQLAILEVAKLLKIETSEIIGIGDSHSDFPLLMACGLKVAMGNAVKDLKEIADYVCPSVEEDGVVDVIEKFVLS